MIGTRAAADVPLIRRELHAYATDGGMLEMYYSACVAGLQPIRFLGSDEADAAMLTAGEAQRLAEAELFFVDEDLSDLLESAYPSMPDFAARAHDLPAPYGFVVFARPLIAFVPDGSGGVVPLPTSSPEQDLPVEGTRIVAVSWGPFSLPSWRGGGAWFTFWSESDRCVPPLLVDNEAALGWLPDGEADDSRYRLTRGEGTASWARMLLCAFQLARQENLAEQVTERTPRPERRRTKRARLPARDVRVVRLRRHLREQRDGGGAGRTYQHRWVVRGHWRNAWYASRQEHRPRWIAPYLKGPEGAPLLGGERVTVL